MMTFRRAIRELKPIDSITEKELTADEVLKYLKDDIIMLAERPGCWEASNMEKVFIAHGWFEQTF